MNYDIRTLVDLIVRFIELLIPFVVGLAFLAFLWGGFKFIRAAGDENGREDAKQIIIAGVIGLVVIFSFWGLVRLAMFTVYGSSSPSGYEPTYGNTPSYRLPSFDGWFK